MTRDPYKYFRIEAQELVEQLSQGVLALEKGEPPTNAIHGLLRLAHTLKGAARVVKEVEIAEMAHALEDELSVHRDSLGPVGTEQVTSLLAAIDSIAEHVAALSPAPTPSTPAVASSQDEGLLALRPEKSDVEALLANITEASARTVELEPCLDTAERAQQLATLLADQIDGRRSPAKVAAAQMQTRAIAEELRSVALQLSRALRPGVERLDREIAHVRGAAERLQLVQVKAIFGRLERAASDASRAAKRPIRFSAVGGNLRLDGHVLGDVLPALVQLVRNAVAHGIESVAERERDGKSAAGVVAIEVNRRAGRMHFACRDDGRGIDLDAVYQAAVARGVLPVNEPRPTNAILLDLLLRSGLSTSPDVTEVAGRGVGLDIVRNVAQQLGGKVEIQTEPGVGTTVEVAVPASMASLDALVVASGGSITALPLAAVRQALRYAESELLDEGGRPAIAHGGDVLPLVPLAQVLGRHADAGPMKSITAIVVKGTSASAAIAVDRIVGVQQIIVRPLPSLAPVLPTAYGAWFDTHGNPQLALEPDRLVAAAERMQPPERTPAQRALPLLVIDDSLTTRMLERAILESAGFEVDLAVSGEEGIEMARARRYGAFLVDVEMPGMDGYAFVERTRADPVLGQVPAVLVTSRKAPEERERGMKAGASAYIVKNEFDQTEFVAIIRRLVGFA